MSCAKFLCRKHPRQQPLRLPMKIKTLRQKIDRLDRRLLQLLNRRTALAAAIGKLKQKRGQRIFAPEREANLLRTLFHKNKGPMRAEALRAIYHEIFSSSRACQREVRVAFVGAEHGRSFQVARGRFGTSTVYRGVKDLKTAGEWLQKGKVEAAIASAAVVYQTLKKIRTLPKGCFICGDFDSSPKNSRGASGELY